MFLISWCEQTFAPTQTALEKRLDGTVPADPEDLFLNFDFFLVVFLVDLQRLVGLRNHLAHFVGHCAVLEGESDESLRDFKVVEVFR